LWFFPLFYHCLCKLIHNVFVLSANRCVVCQMRYKRGDRQIKLPCKHVYHSECITKWLSISKVSSAFIKAELFQISRSALLMPIYIYFLSYLTVFLSDMPNLQHRGIWLGIKRQCSIKWARIMEGIRCSHT